MKPPGRRVPSPAPVDVRDEPTAPWRTPTAEPVESPELEIRRCLRRASVLVSEYAVAPEQRLMLLGGARHWASTAIDAIDRLAGETERAIAVPDTIDVVVPGGIEERRR